MKLTKNSHFIKRLLVIIGIAFFSGILSAGENKKNLAIADQYIKAYQQFDIDKMATFYHQDSIFIDPTSAVYGEHQYHMIGKQAIIDKLTKFIKSVGKLTLDYQLEHRFEAAGHVVYQAMVKVSSGHGDTLTTACGAITTIITIKEEKVVEHRDYFDYNNYTATNKKGQQQC